MNRPRVKSMSLCLGLLTMMGATVTSAAASPSASATRFTLGQYIPNTCWLYLHNVHNPERDFVAAHWDRFFDTLRKAGVEQELKQLFLGDLSPDEQSAANAGLDEALQLVQNVSWRKLVAQEVVFSERLGGITPDLILLCRSAPDSLDTNFQALQAIMQKLASLDEDVTLTQTPIRGQMVWRLGAKGVPLKLHLFRRGEVIGIVMGEQAVDDVIGLMAGSHDVTALPQTPRFRKAAAELPPAEDHIAFLDLRLLMQNLDSMFKLFFHDHATGNQATSAPSMAPAPAPPQQIVAKLLNNFGFFDYMMVVAHTEGRREFTTSITRLCPERRNSPLCKMFTERRPFENFARYIPQSATGFKVSTTFDLAQLYHATVDFLRKEVPNGPAVLDQWAAIQEATDFNLEADLLGWWSGEMVSVSLPATTPSPMGGGVFVLFFRVKDASLATAKVNAGIDRIAALMQANNQTLIISPASDVQVPGFRSVTHPLVAMYGLKFIVGVANDQLVISNSADAINACLDTAAGKAPNILSTPRFQKEGLRAPGPVYAATFTDLSNLGQDLASGFFAAGMVGAMIPDEPDTKPIKAIISILGRLSPAIAQIDFFSSSAGVCTFDGQAWHTRDVINYKPAPAPPGTPSAAPAREATPSATR